MYPPPPFFNRYFIFSYLSMAFYVPKFSALYDQIAERKANAISEGLLWIFKFNYCVSSLNTELLKTSTIQFLD